MPFSFRQDKTGFFVTLVLLGIALGVAVTTIVLITIGAAVYDDWHYFIGTWKWVAGSCWIACIVTVLVRLIIFRQQMLQAERRAAEEEQQRQPPVKS